MGKIRIKTLGDEELEKKQQEDAAKRREAKKAMKAQKAVVEGEGAEDAVVAEEVSSDAETSKADSTEKKGKKKSKKTAPVKAKKGKKYLEAKKQVDANKVYSLKEAITLLKKISYTSFDQTLELHLNLKESGLKGEVTLPHGTGKTLNVAIMSSDVLAQIEAGNISFDILIATPADMPKLVKFAKVLGPKGLMPNPKNGTVTDNPEAAAKKFQTGSLRFKSEAKFPLLHVGVGKMSFEDAKLADNVKAFIKAVQLKNIDAAFISGTMTPSVRIELE